MMQKRARRTSPRDITTKRAQALSRIIQQYPRTDAAAAATVALATIADSERHALATSIDDAAQDLGSAAEADRRSHGARRHARRGAATATGHGAGAGSEEENGRPSHAPQTAAVIEYNPANMAKELRIIKIHGKVQGVGYRFFATRVARRLGLKGTIENIRDGYVEAIVEGEKSVIDEWLEELKEGPRYAEVTQHRSGDEGLHRPAR